MSNSFYPTMAADDVVASHLQDKPMPRVNSSVIASRLDCNISFLTASGNQHVTPLQGPISGLHARVPKTSLVLSASNITFLIVAALYVWLSLPMRSQFPLIKTLLFVSFMIHPRCQTCNGALIRLSNRASSNHPLEVKLGATFWSELKIYSSTW